MLEHHFFERYTFVTKTFLSESGSAFDAIKWG